MRIRTVATALLLTVLAGFARPGDAGAQVIDRMRRAAQNAVVGEA